MVRTDIMSSGEKLEGIGNCIMNVLQECIPKSNLAEMTAYMDQYKAQEPDLHYPVKSKDGVPGERGTCRGLVGDLLGESEFGQPLQISNRNYLLGARSDL